MNLSESASKYVVFCGEFMEDCRAILRIARNDLLLLTAATGAAAKPYMDSCLRRNDKSKICVFLRESADKYFKKFRKNLEISPAIRFLLIYNE